MTRVQKSMHYLLPKWRQNAKIDTLFMAKTAEKPNPRENGPLVTRG